MNKIGPKKSKAKFSPLKSTNSEVSQQEEPVQQKRDISPSPIRRAANRILQENRINKLEELPAAPAPKQQEQVEQKKDQENENSLVQNLMNSPLIMRNPKLLEKLSKEGNSFFKSDKKNNKVLKEGNVLKATSDIWNDEFLVITVKILIIVSIVAVIMLCVYILFKIFSINYWKKVFSRRSMSG